MDGAGSLVDFNEEAGRVFGLRREHAIGRSLGELIVPPELRDAHRAGLARFMASGVSRIIGRRIEVDAVRADGVRFPVELTIAVLQQTPAIFIAHLRDIHGRVQAERRLKATAAVSQALAAATAVDGAISATLRALGESLGLNTLQYWHVPPEGDRLQFGAVWPESATGAAFASEAFVPGEGLPGSVWQTGEPQWIDDVQAHPELPRYPHFRDAGIRTALAFPVKVRGTVSAVIEAFSCEVIVKEPELLAVLAALGGQLGHLLQEISARAETARARDEAEEANRLKDEFLSMASHELRTPLNAVIGWVHLIRQGKLTGAPLERAIDAIDRNATSQARLVNDLLDMSRIITGKFQLELRPVDPREVLHAALEVIKPAADAKGIHISVDAPADAVTLYADAGRLQQVFWNVFSNAVKFTPRKGAIAVRLSYPNETMELRVRDSGVGIDPRFLPRVFERFTQADQTAVRVHGGLGLGLSIAKQFMDLHGGTIELTSAGLGHGTEVTLTLPTVARHARASAQADRDGVRLAGLHVLVVDDEPEARDRTAALLDAAGARAECAASVEEALGCLTQSPFDVVVCAMTMAGEAGARLATELQTRPPAKSAGVRRVALLAGDAGDDAALRVGFDEVVHQPVTAEELVAAVAPDGRRAT
jgi:PAS domain S-box-containing protein